MPRSPNCNHSEIQTSTMRVIAIYMHRTNLQIRIPKSKLSRNFTLRPQPKKSWNCLFTKPQNKSLTSNDCKQNQRFFSPGRRFELHLWLLVADVTAHWRPVVATALEVEVVRRFVANPRSLASDCLDSTLLLMEEIRLTSWYGKYPIIYMVLYIPGCAGFLPSTVSLLEIVLDFWALWIPIGLVLDFVYFDGDVLNEDSYASSHNHCFSEKWVDLR